VDNQSSPEIELAATKAVAATWEDAVTLTLTIRDLLETGSIPPAELAAVGQPVRPLLAEIERLLSFFALMRDLAK